MLQALLLSYDNYLHALDTTSGQEMWKFGAGGEAATPAIAGGVVYFGCADGYLHAAK